MTTAHVTLKRDSSLRSTLMAPVRLVRKHGHSLMLAVVTLVFMFPFYWVFSHSFEPASEFANNRPGLWPAHSTLSNYKTVLSQDGFYHYILNSFIVATVTTVITLTFGALAGYSLARLPIRGRGWILAFVTLAGFFPLTAMMGPLFKLMDDLGLLNTYFGLSCADLIYTLPLTTWLLASLFSQLPAEIEEAAMVDGCRRLTALWRIVIPLAAPAMATAGIFSFILAWSDFTFSLAFLQTPNHYTATLAIIDVGFSKYQTYYNYIDAAVIITALPIFVLVLIAQRRIVSGLTAGAVK